MAAKKKPSKIRTKPPGRMGPAGKGRRTGTEIMGVTGYDRKSKKQQDRSAISEELVDRKSSKDEGR
jgi:hypothetical protein